MRWSILIPTIPETAAKLARLQDILYPQIAPVNNLVEVVVYETERYSPNQSHLCRGEKRNNLIEMCNGEYFSFVDDDDIVASTYVEDILDALEYDPDVITFEGWMTTNGINRVDWEIKLGEDYVERNGKYYRFPNHLCVFRKSIVEDIKFPRINDGEDYEWAKSIHDKGLLKSTIHIKKHLYHYDFITKNGKI